MKVLMPNLQFIEERGSWGERHWSKHRNPTTTTGHSQDIELHELFSIPGVPEDSTILVFAGSSGQVASMLKAKKFIFADLSRDRVDFARKNIPKEFAEKTDFVVCNAHFLPFKDDVADFAFSFEPIPVIEILYFLPQLIRCVKKGIIITYYRDYPSVSDALSCIASAYGLRLKLACMKVNANAVALIPKKGSLDVKIETYLITKNSKKMAAMDLKIIDAANKIKMSKGILEKSDLAGIKKSLNLNKNNFKGALKRITLLMKKSCFGSNLKMEIEY